MQDPSREWRQARKQLDRLEERRFYTHFNLVTGVVFLVAVGLDLKRRRPYRGVELFFGGTNLVFGLSDVYTKHRLRQVLRDD